MKKFKKNILVVAALSITLLSTFVSQAGQGMRTVENIQTVRSENSVATLGSPRGRLVAALDTQIMDKGNGVVDIYAEVMCHVPVARIRFMLYLQQLDEETKRWINVDSQIYDFLASDNPDEDLSDAVASYEVHNVERGQRYRLRGSVAVANFEGTDVEGWSIDVGDLYVE